MCLWKVGMYDKSLKMYDNYLIIKQTKIFSIVESNFLVLKQIPKSKTYTANICIIISLEIISKIINQSNWYKLQTQ